MVFVYVHGINQISVHQNLISPLFSVVGLNHMKRNAEKEELELPEISPKKYWIFMVSVWRIHIRILNNVWFHFETNEFQNENSQEEPNLICNKF